VLYCKPNADKVVGVFQKNDFLHVIENYEQEEGFVFAPFQGGKIILIPQNQSEVIVERKSNADYYVQKEVAHNEDLNAKIDFERSVKNAVRSIERGDFKKVVLSRKEVLQLKNFSLTTVFQRLLAQYPTAFVYCFFHPKVGLWMGATPEQFLKIKEDSLQTVALAGTQAGSDPKKVVWQDKEKVEQQIVTDYIIHNLQGLASEITVSSPYTVNAGLVNHLKTDITALFPNHKFLKKAIEQLHPTPAVCGFPRESAREYIINSENHDREYYSGFLGEWNLDLATFRTQHTDLYVNLRCMKIVGHAAELFIGCGITKESDPEKEYIETVNKSTTMKKVLDF
jgi:isochorismate synthase